MQCEGGENELLGSFFGFIFLLFPIKVAQGQAYSSQAGSFLGIGDWRILRFLRRILRLTFGSLWQFFIQTWILFQNILL